MGCALMSTSVYWIHHPEHTDMFTQGYIGISNNTKQRFHEHRYKTNNTHLKNAIKKYGWDTLLKTIILVADESYCLMIESQLRNIDKIGWNIIKGGGKPPTTPWNKGKKLPKTKLAHLDNHMFKKGHKPWNDGLVYTIELINKIYDIGSYTRGKTAWNKGLKLNEDLNQKLHKKVNCIYCNKQGNIGNITRWHMDNCKDKK